MHIYAKIFGSGCGVFKIITIFEQTKIKFKLLWN